ncbi:beta strand repeat-containing protein, partial [Mucilaginibacter agri]
MKKILLFLLVLVGTINAYAQSITFSDAFESNIVMTRLSVQDGTGRYIYSTYPAMSASAYDAIYQTRWNTSLNRWEIIFGASGVGPAPTYTLITPDVEWYASGSGSPYPPDLTSGNWQAGPWGGGTLILTSASGQLSGSTVAPTVTTGASSGITSSTATLVGNVSSDGGASVTEKGIVYSTSANPTTSDSKVTNGTGTGAISVNVSSLAAGTTYHYRAYAINSVGTSYGTDASFTTSAAAVTVSSVTRLEGTPTNTGNVSFNAVFSGSVTGVTASSFSLTTTGTLTAAAISAVSGSGTTYTVTVNTGIGDGTLRLNVTGIGVSPTISNIPYTAGEVYTIDKTLPTISITGNPPSITNSSSATFTFTGTDASGIASYQSSLDGGPYNTSTSPISFIGLAAGAHTFSLRSVDMAGNTSLPASYTWTIDETSPTLTITSSAGASGGTTSISPIPFTATFSESVTGFTAADLVISNGTASGFSGSGTTYAFNVTPSASGAVTVNIPAAVAQDAAGNNNAAATQFSISYVTAPTVTTGASSSITSSGATLAGNVSSDGSASVTEKGVVYSTSANPTISDLKATNGTGTGAISVGVSGLAASTTYHYRAYATNSVGTSYGADASFTTSAAAASITTTGSFTVLTTTYGAASSGSSISVTGTGLSAGITVTPSNPAFEVSSDGTTYSSGFTAGSSGTVSLTLYVRLKSTASAGSYNAGGVGLSSGAVNQTVNIPTSMVSPAPLTIAANNQTKVYGAAVPTLVASYTGFVNGDTPASLTIVPTLSTTATPASSVAGSPYAITASGAVDANYTITYVAGTLTVTPASLTITANNKIKVYGAAVPILTASYTGFVNGDTPLSLTTSPILSTTATPASSVAGSPYAITASGAVNANYTISYVPGALTVTPASLMITADNQTKVYGAAVPALTASYAGFVNGDTPISLNTLPTLSTTATS